MDLEQTAPADSAVADSSAAQADDTTATLGTAQADPATLVDENAELLALLPADDGMEEIEHEGIKAKVPKELKDAFLRQQDYTRKTQEVAELRRQTEAAQTAMQQQAAFQQENLKEVASIVSLDNQIAEYNKVDWAGLIAQNPQQAQLLDRQLRELQGQRAQLANTLTQKQERKALEMQQATARQIQENHRELERDIKGWSPELGSKLVEYGKKMGLPAVTVATPPAFVKILHKAFQMDQLIAQKTARPAATPAAPASRVGARASTAVTDPDKLSPDEWRKWRDAQIEAKRKKR